MNFIKEKKNFRSKDPGSHPNETYENVKILKYIVNIGCSITGVASTV